MVKQDLARNKVVSLILAFTLISHSLAFDDRSRLGTYVTTIPIFRTKGNTNVVTVGVGTPGQDLNLTLLTGIEYVMVTANTCQGCVQDSQTFRTSQSSTFASTQTDLNYSYINPYQSPPSITDLTGLIFTDVISDARQDSSSHPLVLVENNHPEGSTADLTGSFALGSSGFFGLGIDESNSKNSLVAEAQAKDSNGYTTIGFDIQPMSNDVGTVAGTMDWGAAPFAAYEGDFNWITPTLNPSGSWSFPFDKMSVAKHDIGTAGSNALLDPGYNVIIVPPNVAKQVYAHIADAAQDSTINQRWNIPCGTNFSFSITLNGKTYKIPEDQLIQQRNSKTCWGAVVSWGNDTLPADEGLVVLGTPFMSTVYSVIYYTPNERFVGIAGKPGSVNASANGGSGSGKLSGKTIGIIMAVVIVGLIATMIFCFIRSRTSYEGMHFRALKRQWRAAAVTAQMINPMAIPPPMIITPPPLHGLGHERQVIAPPIWLARNSVVEAGAGMGMDPEALGYYSQVPQDQGAYGWNARARVDEEPEMAQVGRRSSKHHHHYHHHRHSGDSERDPVDFRAAQPGGQYNQFPPMQGMGHPGQGGYYGDPRMGMGGGMGMGMHGMGGMGPMGPMGMQGMGGMGPMGPGQMGMGMGGGGMMQPQMGQVGGVMIPPVGYPEQYGGNPPPYDEYGRHERPGFFRRLFGRA